jgi:hypothetical protein
MSAHGIGRLVQKDEYGKSAARQKAAFLSRPVGSPWYPARYPIQRANCRSVDDGTVLYMAEENIQPIRPKNVSAFTGLAGKYFKRFDPARGKFVSNVKAEFPDD